MQSTYHLEFTKMLAKAGVSLVDVKRDQTPLAEIEKPKMVHRDGGWIFWRTYPPWNRFHRDTKNVRNHLRAERLPAAWFRMRRRYIKSLTNISTKQTSKNKAIDEGFNISTYSTWTHRVWLSVAGVAIARNCESENFMPLLPVCLPLLRRRCCLPWRCARKRGHYSVANRSECLISLRPPYP